MICYYYIIQAFDQHQKIDVPFPKSHGQGQVVSCFEGYASKDVNLRITVAKFPKSYWLEENLFL
jgi:hypothetical protein